RDFPGNNFNRAWWTNEFAELTRHAAHPAVGVAHECRRTAIMIRHAAVPFLLGILHRDLGSPEQHVLEMFDRNGKPCDDGGQIKPLAPVKFRSWNSNGHTLVPCPLVVTLVEPRRMFDLQTGFTGLNRLQDQRKVN